MDKEKLSAQYHKMTFRPHKYTVWNEATARELCGIIGIDPEELSDRSFSQTRREKQGEDKNFQYEATDTFRRLIDFTHRYNKTDDCRMLASVVVQGAAFDNLKLDIGAIITKLEPNYKLVEVHSKVLLPKEIVTWEKLDRHFTTKSYSSFAHLASSLTDPANNFASTWQLGRRPQYLSDNCQAKRLIFYESWKVHPELEEGCSTMELQVFGSAAHAFVYGDVNRYVDLTTRTLGGIRGMFCFRTLSGDTNKSRRKLPSFWEKVVGDYSAIQLTAPEPKVKPTPLGKIRKTKEYLYSKLQELGAETFTKMIDEFVLEMNLKSIVF